MDFSNHRANHASERAFRRLEPILLQYIRQHPTPLEVPAPFGNLPETFRNTINRTLREYRLWRWEGSFTSAEFDNAWAGTTVTTRGGSVRIGPRESKEAAVRAVPSTGPLFGQVIECPLDTTILLAILLLHDKGAFVLPTHLVLLNDSTELEEIIRDRNLVNIAFAPHPPGGYVLF